MTEVQRGPDVFRDDLAGNLASLVERQAPSRPQRTTLPVLPGDDPGFMPAGLHPEHETAYLRVPELVGAILAVLSRRVAW